MFVHLKMASTMLENSLDMINYFFPYENINEDKTSTNEYACTNCGSKYTQISRRNSHMKYCGKPINCDLCGKPFKSKQALVGHFNAKHTDKFKCDSCGKCFESASKLERHKMTHSMDKNVSCPKCDKKFLRRDNMIQHVQNVHYEVFYNEPSPPSPSTVDSLMKSGWW